MPSSSNSGRSRYYISVISYEQCYNYKQSDTTQSSANYMNYETIQNPVSQPIPENGSQTVDTVFSNATPVLRRSSRVIKTPNRLIY